MDKGEKGASHPDGVPGKYEYPALDAEPGYWAEKWWAEFKWRLAMSWRESYVTEVLCLNMGSGSFSSSGTTCSAGVERGECGRG